MGWAVLPNILAVLAKSAFPSFFTIKLLGKREQKNRERAEAMSHSHLERLCKFTGQGQKIPLYPSQKLR